MSNQENDSSRKYPPAYEKLIPIALGIILIVIVVLLAIVLGVALDLFPWAGRSLLGEEVLNGFH